MLALMIQLWENILKCVIRNIMTKQKFKTIRIRSMLELYVVKATRTVPRREGGGNPSDLADKHTSTVLRGERSRKAPYLLD